MYKPLEEFDECPRCGVALLKGEDCPVCEEERKVPQPRKKQPYINTAAKKRKPWQNRKDKYGSY